MAGYGRQNLPLRLAFVIPAFNTAQRMIRFSDEKTGLVFLFFGSLVSIFGIPGDRLLPIIGGQTQPGGFRVLLIASFRSFLGSMVISLFRRLQTLVPRLQSPVTSFVLWVIVIPMIAGS